MSSSAWIVLAALVVVVVVLFVVMWARSAVRRRELRSAFGDEYDVAVAEQGSRSRGEQELEQRRERHDGLELRPLTAASRTVYTNEWKAVQARFVDRPHNAVAEADELIRSVMVERGYPTSSFEQQAADLSVQHAAVVTDYRTAHDLATKAPGDASTEDLRQAMVHYRSLFAELVDLRPTTAAEPSPPLSTGNVHQDARNDLSS